MASMGSPPAAVSPFSGWIQESKSLSAYSSPGQECHFFLS